MPQGTNRIWYLTVILSHNNLFVPHWHYTLIYGLPVQNVTFLSETKYTWIVHFTWPTIYLFTLYDRFEFKILITIYIIERYLISKIPSTVIWYRFQQDITYRDLFIFLHFSGTWTFFKILWSVMSMCSFIALASLSWPYWSFAPSFFKEFYIWNRLVYYASGVS